MNNDFLEGLRGLDSLAAKCQAIPIGIEVNKEWFEQQIRIGTIVNKPQDTPLVPTFIQGIPMQFTDEVATYRFIYKEEKETK